MHLQVSNEHYYLIIRAFMTYPHLIGNNQGFHVYPKEIYLADILHLYCKN